ncbi:beta-propeller fold lactonase family protein [Sediminibacterium soli]|uniref:beta-propeller fold lactonase family protein n=1 Tax=Sediminibacterium soli TaxID=2698829 RepID=UPI00137A81F3|nr:beta-propeller fold lactonase family protein [Sediminibacterium soli]NCI46799.1 beta-propeller fold lactonase family protein [Sediminibacterium soli]
MRRLFTVLPLVLLWAAAAAQHGSLLVANKSDNTVSVFDVATKKQLALLPVGEAPHELAVSPDGRTAVVCNYGAATPGNSVTVIDISGRKALRTISTGQYTRPHGIEFTSNHELVITSEATRQLFRLNLQTDKVSRVVHTAQERSHMVAWSASDAMAYVSNIVSGSVSAVDTKQDTVVHLAALKQGIEGIAVSPDGKELWVANRNDSTVTAIDTKSWKQLAILPAHDLAYRVRFLHSGKYVMVSNGNAGNLSIYDVAKKQRIKDIDFKTLVPYAQPDSKGQPPAQPVPGGITVSEDDRYIFVSVTGYKLAAMIDTRSWTITGSFQTGNTPDGIYYSPLTLKP